MRLDAQTHARVVADVAARTGCRYPLAREPMVLRRSTWETIRARVDALWRGLRRRAGPGPIPGAPPLTDADLIGCVDFHVQGDDARVIEVNAGPPGRLGLTEAIEQAYRRVLGLPPAAPNLGFEDRLADAVSARGRHRRVAIAVSPLASSAALGPHYAHVARILRDRGVDAEVVPADRITPEDTPPRVFNLVIVGTWRDHPATFAGLSAAFAAHPERFFPNPAVFALGNKGLLADLWADGHRDGLLPSLRLSAVDGPEAITDALGPRVVLKPLDDYGCSGVTIAPDAAALAAAHATAADRLIAQAWFPPDRRPMPGPDGVDQPTGFSLRVGVLNGRAHSARCYAFSDPLTAGALAPVLVTPGGAAC